MLILERGLRLFSRVGRSQMGNVRGKDANPRKGIATCEYRVAIVDTVIGGKDANPRKGIATRGWWYRSPGRYPTVEKMLILERG